MGKLFGTDGVRGIVNDNLTVMLAMKLGVSVAKVLKRDKDKLKFIIGCDTRISKDALKHALIGGILSENADVIDVGVIPTPAVSYLIKKYKADGGFVISASHNPSEYNGIKVFNNEGFKLKDEIEEEIENIILNDFKLSNDINKVGAYYYENNAINDYVDFLKSTVAGKNFAGIKIGLDTAHGASYKTAEKLFQELNVEYMIINNEPDGLNINENAGSTHLEGLQMFVVDNNLTCGISYDGDADRCLMVDELGNVVDGDKIMAIYSNYLKEKGMFKNNTLVGTVMSNLGLVKYCEKNSINFVATKVGDRYVLESMLKNDYILGGEQSGHIIFKEYANTGDGELTSLQILKVLKESGKKLSELASIMEEYPQVLKNVKVSKEGKENYKENININNIISEVTEELNGDGRVLVRPSGTENLIRVMLEGKNIQEISKLCDKIVSVIEKELN